MAPKPMPHPNDDIDHVAARASKQEFTERAKEMRENFNASDLFKAERINALYEQHVKETADAYERITGRRRARLDYLEGQVPIGPGIPAGTSPADKAVLMTAFRTALDKVREASSTRVRAGMLGEAEKYDDDAMRRAVLTYALDNSEVQTVKRWADLHANEAGLMDEVAKLRAVIAGQHFDNLWDSQDFNPLPAPQEVHQLPRMQAASEAARRARSAHSRGVIN